MTTKNTPKQTAYTDKRSDFINYELDKRQAADCKLWLTDALEYDSAVLRTVEADYKISLNYDTRNKCFACWLLPVGDKHENAGFILAGRGSSPLKALKQVMYKHWVAAKGGDWDLINSNAVEIDD